MQAYLMPKMIIAKLEHALNTCLDKPNTKMLQLLTVVEVPVCCGNYCFHMSLSFGTFFGVNPFVVSSHP